MRTLSALAAMMLALSSLAGAAAAQDDRYGPPPAWLDRTPAPAPYKGPYLSWAGKTSPTPGASTAPMRPESPAPARFAYAPPPTPQRLERPIQAHAAPARAYAAPAYAPPPPAPLTPPPAAQAIAAPPQAAPASQAAASRSGVRFYSLHRAYGLQPDPDPKPTGNPLVLIAPPQSAHDDGAAPDDSDDGAKRADHADGQTGAS